MGSNQSYVLRSLSILSVLAGLAFGLAASARGNTMPMTEDAARKVVEEFCQAEFELDAEKRFSLLKFTLGGDSAKLHTAGHGMIPGVVIDPDAERMIVVTSYAVKEVNVTKNRARVTVEYRTVARRGQGGILARFVPHSLERDSVQLHLVYADGRWWVLDPPILRGSLQAMIASYKNIIAEYDARFKVYPENFERDKEQYFIAKDNLRFLESVKKRAH